MGSIVNNQLVNYLEKHNCLPSSQFGFRRRRGAADLLTILQHEWTRTVAQGEHVQVVAVDIAGAFGRVSHVGVIAKAQEADTLRTRRQVSRTRRHPHQLTNPLSRDSPNYLKRSFPYSTIGFWNCLPASVFPAEHPTAKHMNTFKRRVNRHITDQPWS